MKIKDANAAALTNFDVLDFLRRRGAANPTRVLVSVAPSEFKVYDYLIQTAACDQTRESILTFLEKCKEHDLAKAELLNIINVRPTQAVEIDPVIEMCDTRFPEEKVSAILEIINEVLPPGPSKPEAEEDIEEDKEETADTEETKKTELGEDGTEMEAD